jgi:hypothetical protein
MDYVSVLYSVTALGNSTGFYDQSAPFTNCYDFPMAVGYAASQVNASDFTSRDLHPCVFIYFDAYSISVTGMSFTYVQFP